MDLAYFRKIFQYDYWANEKVLNSLESLAPPPEEALKKASHLLMAKAVWFSRLAPVDDAPDLNRVLTLAECRKWNEELKTHFEAYLNRIPEEKLSEKIAYQNTKGAAFETLLSDILTQLMTHGPYHRGQIASLVKKAGGTPASTDFIGYVRE